MRRKAIFGLIQTLFLMGTFMSAFDVAIPDVNETVSIGLDGAPSPTTYLASAQAEWNRTYGGVETDRARNVQQTSDGGYIVAAHTYSFDVAMGDTWLIKTDADGNIEWSVISGWPDWDRPKSIQQTGDGGYIVAGRIFVSYAVRYDFWLVKTDGNGTVQWNKTFGGSEADWAYSIRQTSDGGYVVSGETYSFGAGKDDFWLVKVLPYHDVVITRVTPSKTVVGQGLSIPIHVTVGNPGYFTETFNLTAYYNSSLIETKTVSDLAPDTVRTVTFTWNTTDVSLGNYTISAYATPVANETQIDNNICVDGMVQIRTPILDVAVTEVELQKTVVGTEYSMWILVDVVNKGDFTENFNVTIHANATAIATKTISLASGKSTAIIFTWNTTGFSKGNYTTTATALLVGDNNPHDNTYINGWVCVVMPGDADADGDIDIYDVVMITSIYGSRWWQPLYNPNVDWLDDGLINIYDVVVATSRYGFGFSSLRS